MAKFDEKADWASEARRYYLNIVGKYGPQVQALLKKAAALDIQTICPLHGPVLTGDLGKYLNYYDMWSSYKPEEPEKILVASASIHGHTRSAAHILAEKLRAKGAKVVEMDLTRTDVSYAVTEAFRCGKTVLACATYDGFLFPPMEALLTHLKTKNFQNRTVGLMENGTWAPMAAKLMRAELDGMKNMTVCDTVVTIRSAVNAAAEAQMDALAEEIVRKINRSNKKHKGSRHFWREPFAVCFCVMRKLLLFVNQDSTCSHQQPQHHEPGTGLPEGVAHGTHQRAGRNHEQTVGHAVHADEGGALVAGDVVVELLALVQEVDVKNRPAPAYSRRWRPSAGAAPTSIQPAPQSRAQTA